MKFKTLNKYIVTPIMLISLLISCTNLEIDETDSLIKESADSSGFPGLSDPESSLGDLYNKIGGDFQTQENMFALSEVTTDTYVVPTRGTDWGDNGVWRQLHTHTWATDHVFIKNSWNNLNQNIFRASEIIASDASAQTEAEAKFIRAFNMFFLMDLFGQVPFREVDEGPEIDPIVLTRSEAYSRVEADLNDALPNLPAGSPGTANTGTATQAAAHFLLAKLYLNAHIYNGTGTPDNADLQRVIDNVNEIESNGFAFHEGYFDIFEPTDDSETIWHISAEVGPRIWNTLHYNQNTPDNTGGGWNGFSTIAEFYDMFEGDPNSNYVGDGQEERRGWVPNTSTADDENFGIGYGFLINQQYDTDGTALETRQGQPLSFPKEIPSLVGNTEVEGVRLIKYHPYDPTDTNDPDSPLVNSFRRHQVLFRYADAYLMKAEAMMRMGNDVTEMVNALRRVRTDTPDLPNVTEEEFLAERGREMYIEFWRRNDLVRFGQFTAPWSLKEVTGDETKNLFPIPATALLSNPNLTQNPGY